MIVGDRLYMFTIYERPTDYPAEFVCRRSYSHPGGVVTDAELYARGPTLESVRAQIPDGQICMARHPTDALAIVEVWF